MLSLMFVLRQNDPQLRQEPRPSKYSAEYGPSLELCLWEELGPFKAWLDFNQDSKYHVTVSESLLLCFDLYKA